VRQHRGDHHPLLTLYAAQHGGRRRAASDGHVRRLNGQPHESHFRHAGGGLVHSGAVLVRIQSRQKPCLEAVP